MCYYKCYFGTIANMLSIDFFFFFTMIVRLYMMFVVYDVDLHIKCIALN